ncbi:glycoside hydrolase family 5 protein [Plicaturopsis crispa FD-325 SS-3]|nr:glycoside hydrolase family 5 protein [Plicaturopsis crispa FD-325 SS-3]
MPRVPSISPATGKATSSSYIHTLDCNFVDNAGRTLLLRGVNLSASSKAPVGQQSYVAHNFWEHAEDGDYTFRGRPLNLDDGSADVHLARLRGWGFNMLRFPVTWEALEHEGPGKYDYDFMDYTVRVLQKCKDHGFRVYMNPHQDIWSRFSGGSGAPYWTLPACGIEPRNFTATQSAIIHCEYPSPYDADPSTLPAMIWSTNYGRLASQTLFTLFYAGRDFAPKCVLDGVNIQDWLQSRYIAAFGQLADRIRDAGDLLEECVIGWDSMNEPFEGLVGWDNLNATPTEQGSTLKKGTYPTPAQSLRLGMGQAQTLDNWTFGTFGPSRDGTVTVDPKGIRMWADPSNEPDGVHPKWGWRRDPDWKLGTCVWAQHGIWDIESGYVLVPDYFKRTSNDDDCDVEFIEDYWKPHFQAWGKRIRQSHPEAILFVQPPVFARPPEIPAADLLGRCAYSGHYYDGLTLVTRHWNWFNADALGLLRGKYKSTLQAVKIGETAIRKSLQEQLAMLKSDTDILGPYPTIVGEIGTPFDMDGKRSYGWTDKGKYFGDYSNQQKALDASLNAADGANGMNWTVWTYCPDHSHVWGDGWNMEDLSLWSPDDMRSRPDAPLDPADASNAQLIHNKSTTGPLFPPRAPSTAATSAVSLNTLPGAYTESHKGQTITSLNSWHNPYDFLTDGARAVRAFSRPWPTAVIGRPKDIQFNIAKAHFTLTVLVRPEDAPTQPDSSSADSSPVLHVEKEKELATEIYVPLVHYAHDKYLVGPQDMQTTDDDEQSQKRSSHESRHSASALAGAAMASSINLATIPASDVSPTSTLLHDDVLDLDVQVSAGRWEVEGQTLRWWYPVPSAEDPPCEYTITITRAEGPIKLAEDLISAGGGGWLDSLCPPEICSIM